MAAQAFLNWGMTSATRKSKLPQNLPPGRNGLRPASWLGNARQHKLAHTTVARAWPEQPGAKQRRLAILASGYVGCACYSSVSEGPILVGLGGFEPPTRSLGNCQDQSQQSTFNDLRAQFNTKIGGNLG